VHKVGRPKKLSFLHLEEGGFPVAGNSCNQIENKMRNMTGFKRYFLCHVQKKTKIPNLLNSNIKY